MMTKWLNVTLALFVAALVLVVIYLPGKDDGLSLPKLTTLALKDINKVQLQRQNNPPIELVKRDGQWWMQSPYQMPVNDFRVQSLLQLSQAESQSQHSLQDLAATRFGLDSPRATVTFNDTLAIRFGKTEPLHHRRYVAIGNQLHTINDTFYYQAAANIEAYLSHALLPPDAHILRLSIPGLELQLQQGQWQRTPAHEQISADASVELINHWRHTQALELRQNGDKTQKADVELVLQDRETPIHFSLQHQGNETILLRLDNGLQYVIGDDIEEQLFRLNDSSPDTDASPDTASES